jgi:hypothetical protein
VWEERGNTLCMIMKTCFCSGAPAHYANPGNSCVMRGGLKLPCVPPHQDLTLPKAVVCKTVERKLNCRPYVGEDF